MNIYWIAIFSCSCYTVKPELIFGIDFFYQTPLPDQEGPSDGSVPSLESMSSRELAYQMTMYDWQLFLCTHEVKLAHICPDTL